MSKILVALGTRPEAIKLLPLVSELKNNGSDVCLYSSGQHKEMLAQVFSDFGIYPDISDDILAHNQSLPSLLSRIVKNSGAVLEQTKADAVVTQGDTVTAFGVSLSSFLLGIPVFHVEAGLRTFDFGAPFPEEYFRTSIDSFCKYLFAPDDISRQNLISEGINESNIFVTGNTVIDAVRMLSDDKDIDKASRSALITVHRRESGREELLNIFSAVKRIAAAYPKMNIYYPVHPTERVSEIAYTYLLGISNIHLLKPLSPRLFYSYLNNADIVLTDSGGVQEEAALLGIPTLVLREKTERQKELSEGKITLVGFDSDNIFRAAVLALNKSKKREVKINTLYPSRHIAKIIKEILG